MVNYHVVVVNKHSEEIVDLAIELHGSWNTKVEIVSLVLTHWVPYMRTMVPLALGKHLVQALPFVYALQYQTGKRDENKKE